MSSRRDRILEEMGLGPQWRLRVAADAARGIAPADTDHNSVKTVVPELASMASSSGGERVARIRQLDWSALKEAVATCEACALATTRTNTVFGVGDEQAEWLLVGEAPGAEEDARGEPFVGQAGRLLDNMLAAIGLRRGENVYIANVLKCRPPGNRNPEALEVERCAPHLERQIDLIGPKLVIAMGRFAAQTLLGTDASIASLRGRLHRYRGLPLIVTYHPAYLLRNLPDKAKAWEDLLFARATMRTLGGRLPI
jgi:DNA polymerase